MAARKKSKIKREKAKEAKKARPRKKVARKVARKKVATKKRIKKKKVVTKKRTKAKAKRPKARAGRQKRASAPRLAAVAPAPLVSFAPPPGERIGTVTHYFTHLSVAIVQLETGTLHEGDTVHIKGHTSDFRQRVESMEVDHARVNEARAGQAVGLRVNEHAREHDTVYKVAA